jgi:nucleolar protein 4
MQEEESYGDALSNSDPGSSDRLEDQIFVRNLSYDTTDDDLMSLFEPFGPIKRATVSLHKETGSSRGFGFVAYSMAEDAKSAVSALKGAVLKGRSISVELAVKRGVIVAEKPTEEGARNRSDAEKAWHDARKARAQRSQAAKAVGGSYDEVDISSQRIVIPSGVRPGLVLLVLGVPEDTKKADLQNALKKHCRKVEVELVTEGHYLAESIETVCFPAGRAFVLTVPSRPACGKLITALNGIAPNSIGLSPGAKGPRGKLCVRTLAQLTQPNFRKRHCRLIIRNISFQANIENVADKLGRFGPLAEVSLPTKESEEEPRKVSSKEKHKGFAFVTYLCSADAIEAVRVATSTDQSKPVLRICNREVAVDYCQSKDRFLVGPAPGEDEEPEQVYNDANTNLDETQEQSEEPTDAMQVDEAGNEGNDNDSDDSSSSGSDSDSSDSEKEETRENGRDEKFVETKAKTEDVGEMRTVFLRGLSLDAQPQDIRHALRSYGRIELAVLVKDKDSGEPRGSAFVKFSKASEADACVTAAKVGDGILILERPCMVDLAVARGEAERLKDSGKGRIDRRHLYLANEGLSLGTAEEVERMPEEEKEKRRSAQAEKKKKLVNPLFAVSPLRLSVRNLKKTITDVELRDLCTTATLKGLKRNRAGRADMEKLLAADAVPATDNALKVPSFGKGGKRQMPSCKVMLDLERVRGGVPQSRGYGFVEFRNHVHALACLRELNQNTAYSSNASGASGGKEGKRSTLIVEFSLENMRKVKILQDREAHRKNPVNKTTANEDDGNDAASDDIDGETMDNNGSSDEDGEIGNDSGAEDDEENERTSGKRTPAAKRRIQDQRRREKQARRTRKKNEAEEAGMEVSQAPDKTTKKRGGMFSRIRDRKKAKKGSNEDET